MALITDGRFSGASRGISIGHISPEAAQGGPIAFVNNGDPILINLVNRTIQVLLTEEDWIERKGNWVKPEPKIKKGYLARYAALVTSANTGGILKI